MATPHIMPLGFIDRPNVNGATFILTNAGESADLRAGTPVTVWRYSPERLAIARVRGTISAVGHTTATFTISGSQIDPRWPEEEDILQPKTPVYLALPDSYEPDPSRMLSQREADAIRRASIRHGEPGRATTPEASDPGGPGEAAEK